MPKKSATTDFFKEDELREPVQKLFPAEDYLTKSEVPFGLKRIDLVFKSRTNGAQLFTVELKIKDWRRAIWQAVHNRQVATFSYVALPQRYASSVDVSLLSELYLGLIAVEPNVAKIVVPARKSRYVNKRLANEIAAHLETEAHV